MSPIIMNITATPYLRTRTLRGGFGSGTQQSGPAFSRVCVRRSPAAFQVVAMAKKTSAKKKAGGASKRSGFGGFGRSEATAVADEPAELDFKKIETRDDYKVYVRTGPNASWWPIAEAAVEGGAQIEAALKERRAKLRKAATKVPEVVLKTKGKMEELQKLEYGYAFQRPTAVEQEGEQVSDTEAVDAEAEDKTDAEEAIQVISLTGPIEMKLPAFMLITANDKAPPPGSLWASYKASNGKPATSQKKVKT